MHSKRNIAPSEKLPVPVEMIEQRIYLIRSQKVMLDADLAQIYEVETRTLNQAVHRNLDRFPGDFMFQLNREELENWRSHIVMSNQAARKGLRRPPYAITEHGAAMLSSVLRSKRAVQMNILIIRAFVRLREMLATHKDLARKVEQLEQRQEKHTLQINAIIKRLVEAPARPTRRFGFEPPKK